MLPIPYGLLPHEMIEIVDNERVIPGLTKIFKLAEDFPYLDNYSLTKERDKYEIIHQRAFMFHDFDNPQSKFTKAHDNPYHALLKCLPSVQEPLLDYNHLNNMRYTFVSDLFSKSSNLNLYIDYYGLSLKLFNNVTLEEHLQSLQTSYIWNIYKQLTNEMLEKAAEMPFKEFEGKFKSQIMEPLADTILTKTVNLFP